MSRCCFTSSSRTQVSDFLVDREPLETWGEGKVEGLSPDRLEVHLRWLGTPSSGEQPREVVLRAVGPRWAGVDLSAPGRLA